MPEWLICTLDTILLFVMLAGYTRTLLETLQPPPDYPMPRLGRLRRLE